MRVNKLMKILIIGADGQLGTDLCKIIPKNEQVPLTIRDLDITKREKVLEVLKKHSPQIVINTAAYHRVDDCEDHEVQAFAVNSIAVKYLAEACQEIDSALVHISTDYVFDGEKNSPYVESDEPKPQSIYGISKLAGEMSVSYLLKKYYLIRSSGLYGKAGCLGKGGGNFVENLLKRAETQSEFRVVADEVVSPTYTVDLAAKIYQLIKSDHYGLYHIVNHGQCSWFEFAQKIFDLIGKKVKVVPISSADYKTKAKRPSYSVLKNTGLQKLGLDDLRSWEEALKAYLNENCDRPRLS